MNTILIALAITLSITACSTAPSHDDNVQRLVQQREQELQAKIKKIEADRKKMDDFVKANETPDQKRYRELKESVVIVDGDDPNYAGTIEKPYREKPPGGKTTDIFLYKQWEFSVKHQKFLPLPKQEAGKEDFSDMSPPSTRKRYIFQLSVDQLDSSFEAWDPEGGYYMFQYTDPDQGNLWLRVPPQFRDCFDNLKLKFDFMQWVSYIVGDYQGRKVIFLEAPRQCMGDLAFTGSKLPMALKSPAALGGGFDSKWSGEAR
ncbi:MAG: hypothetical protein JNM24_02375 [Bdellovibrionaceae bacterium]|nr:hypothetical protein [Pseudobdellovibrionaceae bacterium]